MVSARFGASIHEQCQHFVHETMGGPTRKAVKYEKKALKMALLQLRNMAADWANDPALLMDEKGMVSEEFKLASVHIRSLTHSHSHSHSQVSKEFKFASHVADYPPRATAPSQTQLWLMRATARALYDERASHTKGSLMNEADLGKETVKEIKSFVTESAHFPYLLRLPSALDELGDASCLWMREFYLELCDVAQLP